MRRATSAGFGGGVDGGGFLFGVVVGLLFLGFLLRRLDRGCGHRRLGFLDVGEAGNHLGHALLALGHLVVFLDQQLDRPREARQRGLHLVEAFLDALGDGDLALAGQQLDRAHLAHVHAHRVGGAADFGIDRRQHGHGFLGRGLVVGSGRSRRAQGLGIGCDLVHLDAHVVDHADDVFDLFGIDDVVGQVVIDLGIGQVALFLALGDEHLDIGGLLLLDVLAGHEVSAVTVSKDLEV